MLNGNDSSMPPIVNSGASRKEKFEGSARTLRQAKGASAAIRDVRAYVVHSRNPKLAMQMLTKTYADKLEKHYFAANSPEISIEQSEISLNNAREYSGGLRVFEDLQSAHTAQELQQRLAKHEQMLTSSDATAVAQRREFFKDTHLLGDFGTASGKADHWQFDNMAKFSRPLSIDRHSVPSKNRSFVPPADRLQVSLAQRFGAVKEPAARSMHAPLLARLASYFFHVHR